MNTHAAIFLFAYRDDFPFLYYSCITAKTPSLNCVTLYLLLFFFFLIFRKRIVFVVPRYIRRSFDESRENFHEHSEPGLGYKFRRSSRRPYSNFASFHRPPQGGDDFDQRQFGGHREVEHIVIPHGEGVTHGISFGKGYIPHDSLDDINEQAFDFQTQGTNHLDFGGIRYEENPFDNHENFNKPEWELPFSQSERYTFKDDQPKDQEYKFQTMITSQPPTKEIYLPKFSTNVEEGRSMSQSIGPLPPLPVMKEEQKPAPIVFQDTIDMKEYVEKVEAFARSWPHAAGINNFGWLQNLAPNNNQAQNYNPNQLNPWAGFLQNRNPNGGYQVKEESNEESNRRSLRHLRTRSRRTNADFY